MNRAQEAFNMVSEVLQYDVRGLRETVNDEDIPSVAQPFRAERLAALEYVLALMDSAERWVW